MATARVSINATVEVDVDQWAAEYGCAPTIEAVRSDVKAWARTRVLEHPDGLIAAADPARVKVRA